jgi:hypothetical protein
MDLKPRFLWPNRHGIQSQKSDHAGESPLAHGIFDFNIDVEMPGNLRIALWNQWWPMLEDLRTVGPVWSIGRNPHCVLAVQMFFRSWPSLPIRWRRKCGKAKAR